MLVRQNLFVHAAIENSIREFLEYSTEDVLFFSSISRQKLLLQKKASSLIFWENKCHVRDQMSFGPII